MGSGFAFMVVGGSEVLGTLVLELALSYASSDISHEGLLGEQGGCLVAASFLSFVDEKAFKICKDVVKGAIAVIAMFHGQHRN